MSLGSFFVALVGLLAQWSSERKSNQVGDNVEFLTWLTEHNFGDFRKHIEQNQQTTAAIKALVNDGVSSIENQLTELSKQIATLAMAKPELEFLAQHVPHNVLSEQAIQILTILESSGSGSFNVIEPVHKSPAMLVFDKGQNYECPESRFLPDDIQMLLVHKLVDRDGRSPNSDRYLATRMGSGFVKSLTHR